MSRATAASVNYRITHQTLNAACVKPRCYTSLSFMAGADEFIVAEKPQHGDDSYHLRPAAARVYLYREKDAHDRVVRIRVYRIYEESEYRKHYARLSAARSGMGMLLAGVAALGALTLPRFQDPAVALSVQEAKDAPNAHTTHKSALSIDILEVVRRGFSYLMPPLLCSGIAAGCGLYCARVKSEQQCASWTSFITQCWRSYRWSTGIVERPEMRAAFNAAFNNAFGRAIDRTDRIVEHVALGALLTQHCTTKQKKCIICPSHHEVEDDLGFVANANDDPQVNANDDPQVFALLELAPRRKDSTVVVCNTNTNIVHVL